MTPSRRKIYLAILLAAACANAHAATPPDVEMAAARAAVASAQRTDPRGPAALAMQDAEAALAAAQAAYAKRKYKDAVRLAELAQSAADLAAARARLARARGEVDAKAARNADLRRQLLVVPER